ncbi:DUF4303 domain-containing protein [Agromyces mediolanus]|uniref:DUF4303 domain-containing protein n=1 Tax=Agromyces mediolanus TaxID=41986 RepID=UPI00203B7C4F|nr:DUF4303 domain-containing protein [Agromyces mediolanus]MCM3658854.1 DUF4303 domain-containing protein [Agromyces mediolanus]
MSASALTTADWRALEAHIAERYAEAVDAFLEEHAGERVYGVAAHVFYGETGAVVAWPALAVGSEESLAATAAASRFTPDELRWSPADWAFQLDPSEADDAWAARVEAAARAGDEAHWEAVYERFLRAFASAAKQAKKRLRGEGAVARGFIAVAMDEEWELVPLSLTNAELGRHFPELGEEAQELARLEALPVPERAAALGELIDAYTPGIVSTEQAERLLLGLGEASVDVALERMPRSQRRWQWAKLLADLGIPRDGAIEALATVLRAKKLPEPDRAWAAAALARLGRLDLVLAEAERVPRTVLLRGLAAPYTSFRDRAVRHLPLDYAPLEAALTAHPELAEAMLDELRPGSGFCTIDPGEASTARAALDSPFEVVRRHARLVLDDAGRSA